MTLAGEQYYVTNFCSADGSGNRLRTVELYCITSIAAVANPVNDLARNELRVLGARVIAGHNDSIGELSRDASHFGRLPRSRSPPHPNTQMSSPACVTAPRNAVSTLASASG